MARFYVTVLLTTLAAAAAAAGMVAAAAPREATPTTVDAVSRGGWCKFDARVRAVVKEHLDALNKCDVPRLMAQHPRDFQFLGVNGTSLDRAGMRELYVGLCGPAVKGGPDGPYRFEQRSSSRLGPVLYAELKLTAPHLARPYTLFDAYGTRGDQLVKILSTFDGTELVFKKRPRSS